MEIHKLMMYFKKKLFFKIDFINNFILDYVYINFASKNFYKVIKFNNKNLNVALNFCCFH